MRAPRLLLIGLEPTLVDFSAMPEMNAEKVAKGLAAQLASLRAAGFEAEWCLTDLGETAAVVVRDKLAASTYDLVLIGAGIRAIPTYFLLFEQLINVVHAGAPHAKICFNTQPGDTQAAVLRWLPAST